jgi:hypothetical protein
MKLTNEQRDRLVKLVLKTPPAKTFAGRTTLLGDAHGLALDRSETNQRTDPELIVQQLVDMRADDVLSHLIEQALTYVKGTDIGDELERLLDIVKRQGSERSEVHSRDHEGAVQVAAAAPPSERASSPARPALPPRPQRFVGRG